MLKGNDVTKNLKVMGLDDNRLFLPGWADKIFNDVEAAQYVDGIGVHWYLNFLTPPSVLATTHKRHPTKFILATEACTGSAVVHGPILGDWYRGEEYAADIITVMIHNIIVLIKCKGLRVRDATDTYTIQRSILSQANQAFHISG
ncbi:unnamed protein product [Nippostrongylus brasiliensis]|uniref:Glucosylceramidase n=1 Tax=Nippostrongylus brasiliensis TaxID=27835 RepID=A0A0N4XQD6_NIPBR|nr:unnamed protein product [Nippostrongylus brasiliensis]